MSSISALIKDLSSLNQNYRIPGVAFLTTNETGISETSKFLDKTKKPENGVHLGVSTLHNFDIIVQTKPRFVILIDHGSEVVAFNKKVIELITKANSRLEFQKRLTEEISKTPKLSREAGNVNQWMETEKTAFSSDNHFSYIKELAESGRILPLCLQIQDFKSLGTIAELVHKAGLVFSSIYPSNVCDYFEDNPKLIEDFRKSIDSLSTDDTVIIDSTFCGNISTEIVQHASYAKSQSDAGSYDPYKIRTTWSAPKLHIEEEKTV